ncbi:hypothetical protein IJ182_06495 [bacterium]|nr:hypothetical protein [bacterium]
MKEYEIISKLFPNTKDLFLSDAQIVEINGQKWGITCDEFSFEEDLFTQNQPYTLGQNLVSATLSDLYATGCKPIFYEHALVFPKDKNNEWCEQLALGIKDTLNKANCTLIGGDTGQSRKFRYTGIALGMQIKNISRIFPDKEQNLYITGHLGDANEAIIKRRPTPLFELREIPENALACIDTSGGFMDAIWLLHGINPNFKIEIENPPCKDIGYLFAGAGEYELLYTSDKEDEKAIKIGKVIPNQTGVFLNGKDVKSAPPDPRAYRSIISYILAVKRQVKGFYEHNR